MTEQLDQCDGICQEEDVVLKAGACLAKKSIHYYQHNLCAY